jgi:hypothetical protein
MPPLAVLDPITGQVIRASKVTAVRYERDRPGELVHMDVKKIGRIPPGGGWRAHGRQAGDTAAHKKDFPMLQAGVMVVGALFAVATLLADLLYAALNPRIRFGSSE